VGFEHAKQHVADELVEVGVVDVDLKVAGLGEAVAVREVSAPTGSVAGTAVSAQP